MILFAIPRAGPDPGPENPLRGPPVDAHVPESIARKRRAVLSEQLLIRPHQLVLPIASLRQLAQISLHTLSNQRADFLPLALFGFFPVFVFQEHNTASLRRSKATAAAGRFGRSC